MMKYLFMLLFICSCANVSSTGNFFGTSNSASHTGNAAGNAATDAGNAAATHIQHHQPMMMP